MRRRLVGLAFAGALLAGGSIAGALDGIDEDVVVELLSGIDFVPPRADLDGSLGETAVTTLIALAEDDGATSDPGVRIRAYRALALYPGDPARVALETAVAHHGEATVGVELVYLRAAVDSLAAVAGREAGPTLIPLLGHVSRDIRAATAGALAAARASDAVSALRAQLQVETVEQVRLALSGAIQVLAGPGSN